jgi:hypothetical protein
LDLDCLGDVRLHGQTTTPFLLHRRRHFF